MNTKSSLFRSTLLFAAFVFAFLLAFPALVHAQDSASAAPAISAGTENFVLQLFTELATKYPIIASVIAVMGTMRVWAKPAFSILHSVVELTPSKWDDGKWTTVYDWLTTTSSGKTFAWLLDFIASIKLVPPGAKPIGAVPVPTASVAVSGSSQPLPPSSGDDALQKPAQG